MKKDIAGRKEIEILVNNFYDKVRVDGEIGFIFSDIAKVNWEKHMPIMYDFFENMLFYTGSYTGNPMELHLHVNKLFPFTEAHFNKWLLLFFAAVDETFEGEKAELAKQRAKSIATVMQIKLMADKPVK